MLCGLRSVIMSVANKDLDLRGCDALGVVHLVGIHDAQVATANGLGERHLMPVVWVRLEIAEVSLELRLLGEGVGTGSVVVDSAPCATMARRQSVRVEFRMVRMSMRVPCHGW